MLYESRKRWLVRCRLQALGAGLAVALGAAGAAQAQTDLLNEEFTSVYVEGHLPYKTSAQSSPHVSVHSESTVGGPTSFSFSADAAENWSPAEMDSFGFSSPGGAMGFRINLSGPSAIEARMNTRIHDVFTVLPPPGVSAGTPGLLTFVYKVDGVADVIGTPGENVEDDFAVASMILQVTKYTSDGGTPPAPVPELLKQKLFEVLGTEGLGGDAIGAIDFGFDRYISVDVPFVYGESMALQTRLGVVIFTDNRFFRAVFNPYGELWGGGVIQNVFVDSTNTAELIAIVNEAHPTATVTGVSVDYSPLVTDSFVAPDDADGDGVADAADNCVLVPNEDQADANPGGDDDSSLSGEQRYGNACDADLDDDGIVAASDFFGTFLPCLGQSPEASPDCAIADFDGDDLVGTSDFFSVMRPSLGGAPGPGVSE